MKMVIRTKIIHTQKKMKMKNQFHFVKKNWKKKRYRKKEQKEECAFVEAIKKTERKH